MGNAATKTADEITSNVKDIIDRILAADIPSQIAETGRDVASTLADVGGSAVKTAGGVASDAASTAEKAWGKGLGRTFGDLWKRREVAAGAAGAAIPASKELIEAAAVRLGLKQKREEAHWGNFFFGLVLGAIAGAAIALLTAPRPGREIRDEIAARAREAGDWVPVFQRGAGEADEADATGSAPAGSLGATAAGSETAFGGEAYVTTDTTLGGDASTVGFEETYDTGVPPTLPDTDEGSRGGPSV